jgi:DNA-binding NarL/FixJ family response regulator
MYEQVVDRQTREQILERYQVHAARFDALAGRRKELEQNATADRPSDDEWAQPTPRQLEILQLIADGLANREIARRLFITEETCKSHLCDILARLHARSRAEAVAIGFRRGLLS